MDHQNGGISTADGVGKAALQSLAHPVLDDQAAPGRHHRRPSGLPWLASARGVLDRGHDAAKTFRDWPAPVGFQSWIRSAIEFLAVFGFIGTYGFSTMCFVGIILAFQIMCIIELLFIIPGSAHGDEPEDKGREHASELADLEHVEVGLASFGAGAEEKGTVDSGSSTGLTCNQSTR